MMFDLQLNMRVPRTIYSDSTFQACNPTHLQECPCLIRLFVRQLLNRANQLFCIHELDDITSGLKALSTAPRFSFHY